MGENEEIQDPIMDAIKQAGEELKKELEEGKKQHEEIKKEIRGIGSHLIGLILLGLVGVAILIFSLIGGYKLGTAILNSVKESRKAVIERVDEAQKQIEVKIEKKAEEVLSVIPAKKKVGKKKTRRSAKKEEVEKETPPPTIEISKAPTPTPSEKARKPAPTQKVGKEKKKGKREKATRPGWIDETKKKINQLVKDAFARYKAGREAFKDALAKLEKAKELLTKLEKEGGQYLTPEEKKKMAQLKKWLDQYIEATQRALAAKPRRTDFAANLQRSFRHTLVDPINLFNPDTRRRIVEDPFGSALRALAASRLWELIDDELLNNFISEEIMDDIFGIDKAPAPPQLEVEPSVEEAGEEGVQEPAPEPTVSGTGEGGEVYNPPEPGVQDVGKPEVVNTSGISEETPEVPPLLENVAPPPEEPTVEGAGSPEVVDTSGMASISGETEPAVPDLLEAPPLFEAGGAEPEIIETGAAAVSGEGEPAPPLLPENGAESSSLPAYQPEEPPLF